MNYKMVGNFTLEDAINTGGMFYLDGDQITHAGNSTDARKTDLIIERIKPNVYEYVNGTVDRIDVYKSSSAELSRKIRTHAIFDPSAKNIKVEQGEYMIAYGQYGPVMLFHES